MASIAPRRDEDGAAECGGEFGAREQPLGGEEVGTAQREALAEAGEYVGRRDAFDDEGGGVG